MPGLGSQDQRARIDPARLPWSAVVRVQIPGVSRCTGFAVSPRQIVTAAHCLYGRRLGHMIPAGSVHVLSRYSGAGFARHDVAVSYRIPPGFTPGREHLLQASDIAVLTVQAAMSDTVLIPVQAVAGQAAMLGGYSQDRAEVLTADPECRVLGTINDQVGRPLEVHNCEATLGTSGAPLLVRLANGAWEAGGVQVGAAEGHVGGLAVPAAAVQSLLQR